MKKLRVAMIGQKAAPFYRDGGVEKHVEELSVRLAKKGHDVLVYVRPGYVATQADIWRGVRLKRMPSIPTKHLATWSHTFFSTLSVLTAKADIIHYHGVGPSTLSWLPRLFNPKAKIVTTFHSIDRFHKKWGCFARAYLYLGEWTAVHFAHATIAVSRAIKDYCWKKFRKKVFFIPNGVNLGGKVGENELERWGVKRQKYILTVARLIRHKGIHFLIEAFKRLPEDIRSELKLVIVGAPSFTSDYEYYLKNLAAQDSRIIFTGFQSGETLSQLYGNALLYVHPSQSEGLALTILEAMSYGKCVLVSDIPENVEAINHAGFTFASGNADDLKDKIIGLYNHQELLEEKGRAALEIIKEKFSWDTIADETEKVYKELVGS